MVLRPFGVKDAGFFRVLVITPMQGVPLLVSCCIEAQHVEYRSAVRSAAPPQVGIAFREFQTPKEACPLCRSHKFLVVERKEQFQVVYIRCQHSLHDLLSGG